MCLARTLDIAGLTHVGLVRDCNEDAIATDAAMGFVVLADGMGGYQAGEVASGIAVLSIAAELAEFIFQQREAGARISSQAQAERMLKVVRSTNSAIYKVAKNKPQCAGMGTTLVIGLFSQQKLLSGHIGDSRLYRLRSQDMQKMTVDHSLLQEQIKAGIITAAQAKNATNKNLVTRALGVAPEVELELNEFDIEVDDIYLFCSDGLTDLVEDHVIQSTLNRLSSNLESAAEALVKIANDNGGHDNISVVLVKVNLSN
jgi:serine/threonine protein phosphatase PrpC